MSCLLSNLGAVDRHWRLLYGSAGQRSLPECSASAESFVSSLLTAAPGQPGNTGDADLNSPVTRDEVEGMLRRLKYGRMAGPDGLQAELFKGAYENEGVFHTQ